MPMDAAAVSDLFRGTFAELLGIRFVEATPDRVVAELDYRDELTTVGGSLRGGCFPQLRARPCIQREHATVDRRHVDFAC